MVTSVRRANLGSGKDYREGWINVDINSDYKTDVVADLSQKFPFKNNSLDELLASDLLEHFTKEAGVVFLKECHRVLKINGILTIRTHNIYQVFKQFSHDPEVLIHFLYGDTKETGVFGSHKYSYTKESLIKVLKLIGFEVIDLHEEATNYVCIARKVESKPIRLNIAVIMQSPDMGGAEKYMLSLVDQFIKQKHKVHVATNQGKFLEEIKPITSKTTTIPFVLDIIGDYKGLIKTILLIPYSIYFYSKLLSRFKKEGISIILMSNFTEKLLVSFLSTFYRIPVVWIEYGRLESVFSKNFYLPKVLYRLLKNVPNKIIVPTENTKLGLIEHAKVSLAKLIVIPCGITIPTKVKHEKLERFKGKFVIGNVSRLAEEKGQKYLIQAMRLIVEKIPNSVLLLVGDGPYRKELENLIVFLKLEGKIVLTGYVDDLKKYYESMDIFVFSSTWDLEGFGLVSIEAMAYKIPVIGNDLKPISEVIQDYNTGILVDVKNEKMLTKTILNLINNGPLRKKITQNAFNALKVIYNIEDNSKKLTNILNESLFY